MKKNYDMDLNEIIDILNGKIFTKIKKTIVSMSMIIFSFASLLTPILLPNCQFFSNNWIFYTFIYFIVGVPMTSKIGIASERVRFEIIEKEAQEKLSCLIDELQKENININKNSLIKENQIKEPNLMTNEEKIIRYFYLLDRENQIQVLKQVSNKIKSYKNINELFLYEKEDVNETNKCIQKNLIK